MNETLEKMMEDMAYDIGNFFRNFFGSIDSIIDLAEASPSDVIQGFPAVGNSNVLWETTSRISTTIGLGVAATLVAFFLCFELISIFNRSDTKGWDGIYWILMALLKAAFAITICKHMTMIIGMCFEITSQIVIDLKRTNILNQSSIQLNDLSDQITGYYLDSTSFFTSLSGWILGFFSNLASKGSLIIVKMICMLRFIEIYIFVAVAPLAFSTFISQEYKNIGVSFLKRLIALGLQGVFIAIICIFYTQIVNASLSNLIITGTTDMTGTATTLMGYSILLVIAVFQTGGWSKSLLQIS